MKITVLGTGAIGGLFGSIFHQGGHNVTCVETNEEYVKKIKADGLRLTRGDKDQIVNLKVTSNIEDGGTPDLIMMAVKSYDNAQAAKDCRKAIGPDAVVLTLQNGVGNVEAISEILGADRVIAGTTIFGSTVVEPGWVKSSIEGSIDIGEPSGKITPRIRRIADELGSCMEIHVVENVIDLIWTKLMVNVGINAIGSLCHLTNGQILDYPTAEKVQDQLLDEALSVAEAKGIKFTVEDIRAYVKNTCIATYSNKASMYQDVERGSVTEVRAINGAIVHWGKVFDIPTPANELITNLMIAREGHGKIGARL